MLSARKLDEEAGLIGDETWTVGGHPAGTTWLRIDQLQAKLDRMEHRCEEQARSIEALLEGAHQAARLRALAESLRNARDYKLDHIQRCLKDVKLRLSGLEDARTLPRDANEPTAVAALEQRVARLETLARHAGLVLAVSIVALVATLVQRI